MIHQNVELYNVRELLPRASGGWQMGRLPSRVRDTLGEFGQEMAVTPAGGEVRFNVGAEPVTVTLTSRGPFLNVAEVWRGPFPESTHAIRADPTEIAVGPSAELERMTRLASAEGLPFDPALARIILPHGWPTALIEIRGAPTPPCPEQAPTRRLLTYGSSITQGGNAATPSGTYAMRAAQILGLDLVNLGTSGSARMDESVADFIAENGEWDVACLELGINVLGWAPEEFARTVGDFLGRIAGSNPNRRVFCTDIFTHGGDWDDFPKIEEFREIVRAQVISLALPNLTHLPGRSLLTSTGGLTADLVHPSLLGHEEIARNLAREIAAL